MRIPPPPIPSRRVRTPMPWDEGPDGEQRRCRPPWRGGWEEDAVMQCYTYCYTLEYIVTYCYIYTEQQPLAHVHTHARMCIQRFKRYSRSGQLFNRGTADGQHVNDIEEQKLPRWWGCFHFNDCIFFAQDLDPLVFWKQKERSVTPTTRAGFK